jgi:hypothetical protein
VKRSQTDVNVHIMTRLYSIFALSLSTPNTSGISTNNSAQRFIYLITQFLL